MKKEKEKWDKIKEMNEILETEKNSLEKEKDELLEIKAEMQDELQEMQAKENQLTARVEELESELGILREKNSDNVLKEIKRKHEEQIRALNIMLKEQIDNCKKLNSENSMLEQQRLKSLEQVEVLMEERRELMAQMEKRQETVVNSREELEKELKLVKTKLAHIEKAQKPRFEQLHTTIQQLKDENERLKAGTVSAVNAVGIHSESLLSPQLSAEEKINKITEENEKLTKRLREQREFIENLMRNKTKLMEQVSAEVKRNGVLVRENNVLFETINKQKERIEILENARETASPQKSRGEADEEEGQVVIGHTTQTQDSKKNDGHLKEKAEDKAESNNKEKEEGKKNKNTNKSDEQREDKGKAKAECQEAKAMVRPDGGAATVDEEDEEAVAGADINVCSSNLVVNVTAPGKKDGNHQVVLRTKGWFSFLPIVGRLYSKHFDSTVEFVL